MAGTFFALQRWPRVSIVFQPHFIQGHTMKDAPQDGRPQSRILPLMELNKFRNVGSLIHNLPVALYVCDQAGALSEFNQRAAQLWGWQGIDAIANVSPCNASDISSDGLPPLPEGVPAAEVIRTGEAVRDHEFVLDRPDGSSVVLLASADPVTDDNGTVVGVIGCLQDVTDLRRAAFQQKALLNELNHRVKNTLATVQLLAAQTIRKCGLPKEVQDDFEARLIALSRAHDHLTRERWELVDLHTIVAKAVEPYSELSSDMVRIRGEQIKVGAQASLTLAMIFHELANNAAKFGALSSEQGKLAVSWAVASDVSQPTLVIDWEESGGPLVNAPERLGFGSRLLQQGITRQFKGSARLDYDPSGLRCRMEIPLPSIPG
jgi:PAS domain S-box-containing protein